MPGFGICEKCAKPFTTKFVCEAKRRRFCSKQCNPGRPRGGQNRNPATADPAKAERNEWIISAYMAGQTLQQIGREHGITRERVRQIVEKRFPVKTLRQAQRGKNDYPASMFGRELTCFICWEPFRTGDSRKLTADNPTCSGRCRDLRVRAASRLEPERCKARQARSNIRRGVQGGQYAWAARTLAGVKPGRGSYRTFDPNGKISQAYAEVLRLREGKTPPASEVA